MSKKKNNGFQFKQFYIEHQHCAMKVGTDSILLGSWTDVSAAKRILDIGTGSGLLAIMLAQKSSSNVSIVGLDTNSEAIHQAQRNGNHSIWSGKLSFINQSIQDYEQADKCDLIISNPPYFEPKSIVGNIVVSGDISPGRLQARQTTELTHAELLFNVRRLLAPEGQFYCVLPELAAENFIQTAQFHSLFCNEQLHISPKSASKVIRRLLCFSLKDRARHNHYMSIQNETGDYTEAYRQLCRDYYLNF